ncbi:oxidoreductase (plasmid) [Paroceanicella profunda]|uniref:Oxidoreductase n=2 Tax=Paroceanicella profunda TaxID=2579971 RepID=A0A5B8FJA4_9RHOB|nr:molybdopterin-dependent oxidoreductase [Paroceanicella profunda]QDL94691.1 oxidoreductase [Paroceanicella profunda]
MLAGSVAAADPLPIPDGPPLLTIEGNISNTNVGDTAQFDRAMLESIGMVSFTTTTPWFTGETTFEGVPMAKLLDLVGAEGTRIEAVALNDYRTEVPIADFAKYGTILALKRDGAYMPIRDKGPLFIVYDYDSASELQSQDFYSRSVWQLARIVVK